MKDATTLQVGDSVRRVHPSLRDIYAEHPQGTAHVITERSTTAMNCASGVAFRISPEPAELGGGWWDASWFGPVGRT